MSRFIEAFPQPLAGRSEAPFRTVVRQWAARVRALLNPPSEDEVAVAQVIALHEACMPIWVVEDSLSVRECVACSHRKMQEYSGYLLLANDSECTVLMDLRASRYVEVAPRVLLVIDGVANARLFVASLVNVRRGQQQGRASREMAEQ